MEMVNNFAHLKMKLVNDLKNEIVSDLKNEIVNDLEDKNEIASQLKDLKTSIFTELKNEIVKDIKDIIVKELKNEIVTELKGLKNDLKNVKDTLFTEMNNVKGELNKTVSLSNLNITNSVTNGITEMMTASDTKLRSDLHNFLTGIVKDIKTTLDQEIRGILAQIEDLNSRRLPELTHVLTNTNTKVNDIFFENELIKHQLSLEEEIRKYDDDLESLKIITRETINSINSKLK
jgi:hypothetical protein